MSGTFLLYGALALLAGISFFFILPETKGKTLEEIDLELRFNRCSFDWLNKKIPFKKKKEKGRHVFFVTSSGCTTKRDVVPSSAGDAILHTTTEFRFTSPVRTENSEQANPTMPF